jgi:pilus assembly protein Flp/PilA
MVQKLMAFFREDDGASAVEYGLIVGLIAVALVVVLVALGGPQGLGGLFQKVADCVSNAGNC